MATWPISLPDWKFPLSDKTQPGILRTQMDAGPAKTRRRYSAVPKNFNTGFQCNGTQRFILESFYETNKALSFDRVDPIKGGTQSFRFLTSPDFRIVAGAELASERVYEVTLALERLPGIPDKAFTVLLDSDYANPLINFSRPDPGWYFGSDGLLKEAAIDAMRFDYDPATGELLGLLIEEARTNSLLDSRDMTTVSWTNDELSILRDAVGIDGFANRACTLTKSITTSDAKGTQSVTIVDNSNTHTGYVFVKKDNDESRFPEAGISMIGGTTAVSLFTQINTKTGEITDRVNDNSGISSIDDFGDWWRLTLSIANNSTGNTSLELVLRPSASTIFGTFETTATGSAIFDQAQIELNASFPPSPIITAGSTVTRSADVATVTDLSWYNQSEGTFVVDGISNEAPSRFIELSDGTSNNLISIRTNSSGNVEATIVNGGSSELQIIGDSVLNTNSKIAFSFKTNDSTLVKDGSVAGSDSVVSIPAVSEVSIGKFRGDDLYINGHIRSLHYYPARLSNAKLQQLTG